MRSRIIASFAVVALTLHAQSRAAERPNIIIMLADDWGFSDVGSFGSEIRTPNLDALAKAGVRFSNFHVAGSCSPTRAMLQTGVSNHRAGLGNMPETIPPEHVGKPGYDQALNQRTVTIADMLRAAGYRTYLTGKWHLGRKPGQLPHERGYDRAFSMADAGADNFEQKPIQGLYDKANWSENGRAVTLPKTYYSSTFIIDKTIEYIERDRASGKPFLASINFMANHTPVQAPDAYIARYAGMYDAGWTALRQERARRAAHLGIIPAIPIATMPTMPDWSRLAPETQLAASRAMEVYGGMAEAMDAEIGRLIAHLKKTGDYENTIFVFLSDNGAEALDPMAAFVSRMNVRYYYDTSYAAIGRRGSFTAVGPGWASASVSPLRGYKFTAYEGGLRVPFIFAWPGNAELRSGSIAPGFAYATDIAPTLLAMAGLRPHGGAFSGRAVEPMTGRNLTPMLTGAADAVRAPEESLGYELSGNAALFRGDYKLVKNLPPNGDGRWRLFNIAADPGETRDVSHAEPALAAIMQRDYEAFAREDQVLPMPDGYTAGDQITRHAFKTTLLPKLKRAGLWIALGIAILAGIALWHHRRKRAA